jgi:hypothetical protein
VVVAQGDVIEGGRDHVGLQVGLAHLVLARLQPRHQPVRYENVDVRVPRRHHSPRPEHGPVRHQRNAHVHPIELIRPVVKLEAVRRMDVHQVRVFEGCRRGPQPRRLVVTRRHDVGNTSPCGDAGRLLKEADDDVRSGPDRVKDVAGVNNDVNVPLQDGVDRPSVGLLDVDLPLVAVRLGVEPRVARVPEMRIRDVGYADYVVEILPA